jgi:hypothetical protein
VEELATQRTTEELATVLTTSSLYHVEIGRQGLELLFLTVDHAKRTTDSPSPSGSATAHDPTQRTQRDSATKRSEQTSSASPRPLDEVGDDLAELSSSDPECGSLRSLRSACQSSDRSSRSVRHPNSHPASVDHRSTDSTTTRDQQTSISLARMVRMESDSDHRRESVSVSNRVSLHETPSRCHRHLWEWGKCLTVERLTTHAVGRYSRLRTMGVLGSDHRSSISSSSSDAICASQYFSVASVAIFSNSPRTPRPAPPIIADSISVRR